MSTQEAAGPGMVLSWVAIAIAGMITAGYGSRRAVTHATRLALGLNVSPYLIGVVVLAVGTDIPEIANSILASAAGHGDLNVGDSVGSVAMQITLGLGLVGLIGGSFAIGRGRVLPVTLLTVLFLAVGAVLTGDGFFSRGDAAILVAGWLASVYFVWRSARTLAEPVMEQPAGKPLAEAAAVLFFLAIVGLGAAAMVRAVIALAPLLGIPEYLISFFGASIGTSMPEIVLNISAIRAGRRDLAVGDMLGACLVDGTLSIGIGPLFFPVAVTGALAMRGAMTAIGAVTIAALLLLTWQRIDRRIGVALLVTYLLMYASFLA